MTVPSKVPVPDAPRKKSRVVPRSAMEAALQRRAYECRERREFDEACKRGRRDWTDPPRFTYESPCGGWRVLMDNRGRPWWTVQRVVLGHVEWFVDFPLYATPAAIFAFINSMEKTPCDP